MILDQNWRFICDDDHASALAQQYIPALLRKDSNQGCNGSPAHLPVGSRTRITGKKNQVTLLQKHLQQVQQLGDIRRDPPRFGAREAA
jgi:hypothetical protein